MTELMRSEGTGGRVRECEREVFVLCEKKRKRKKKEKRIWWKGVIASQREREIFVNVW